MQVYNDELMHYGKIGMKWGHHKNIKTARKDAEEFARAKMFAGSKIGANRPVLEILAANVARNSKNLKQLYRYAIKSIDDINKIPMYPVGLGNVYLSRTSSVSAISGGHLSDGIINKINNPEDQPTLLGTKLSGKETA